MQRAHESCMPLLPPLALQCLLRGGPPVGFFGQDATDGPGAGTSRAHSSWVCVAHLPIPAAVLLPIACVTVGVLKREWHRAVPAAKPGHARVDQCEPATSALSAARRAPLPAVNTSPQLGTSGKVNGHWRRSASSLQGRGRGGRRRPGLAAFVIIIYACARCCMRGAEARAAAAAGLIFWFDFVKERRRRENGRGIVPRHG